MSSSPLVAYSVRTARLVLRCYELQDAAEVREVAARNKSWLVPWMPWASAEPCTVEEKLEVLRDFRSRFDRGDEFPFGVFDRESGGFLGSAGLHARGPAGVLEIGYWIDHERRGAGLATEAAMALTFVAFRTRPVGRVEVRLQPKNVASRRVAEKCGFRFEGLLRGALRFEDDDYRDQELFAMTREDFSSSPAAGLECELFDALERPLAWTTP